MQSVQDYMDSLPEERKIAVQKLRNILQQNLPEGFEECLQYGMVSYVVPHSIYPDGYHCKPEDALPFISVASQKNHIALYHMGIYSDPEVLDWWKEAYAEQAPTKLDMGKSCVRFKKPEHIPYELIAELARKITVQDWIDRYEEVVKR